MITALVRLSPSAAGLFWQGGLWAVLLCLIVFGVSFVWLLS